MVQKSHRKKEKESREQWKPRNERISTEFSGGAVDYKKETRIEVNAAYIPPLSFRIRKSQSSSLVK